jgi:hypothetical protein
VRRGRCDGVEIACATAGLGARVVVNEGETIVIGVEGAPGGANLVLQPVEVDCGNGRDDDFDGAIDCEDSECFFNAEYL